MSLYAFSNGHNFLDRIGVPRLQEYTSNVVINRKDFAEQEATGKIEWREDGVYLEIDGKYRRGFLYNKDYLTDQYGMPKYHLAKCQRLQSYENNGTLNNYYYWSNAPRVLVTKRFTEEKFEDVALNLCGYCRKELIYEVVAKSTSTEDAFEGLDGMPDPTTARDIFNRPLNWQAISRIYRQQVNYTCEQCGFGAEDLISTSDRRFIDTDHIIGYRLMDTSEGNLQCLCALCHIFKDQYHEAHLQKGHVRARLTEFIEKYGKVLSHKSPGLLARYRQGYG